MWGRVFGCCFFGGAPFLPGCRLPKELFGKLPWLGFHNRVEVASPGTRVRQTGGGYPGRLPFPTQAGLMPTVWCGYHAAEWRGLSELLAFRPCTAIGSCISPSPAVFEGDLYGPGQHAEVRAQVRPAPLGGLLQRDRRACCLVFVRRRLHGTDDACEVCPPSPSSPRYKA